MKNILIVDDDDTIRDVLSYALSGFGYKTFKANNGVKALEALELNPDIEIVILDLGMPVMSGQELCPRLKKLKPSLEVIVSSAFVDEITLKELHDIGVRCILRKPYPLELLNDIITDLSRCQEI